MSSSVTFKLPLTVFGSTAILMQIFSTDVLTTSKLPHASTSTIY